MRAFLLDAGLAADAFPVWRKEASASWRVPSRTYTGHAQQFVELAAAM